MDLSQKEMLKNFKVFYAHTKKLSKAYVLIDIGALDDKSTRKNGKH